MGCLQMNVEEIKALEEIIAYHAKKYPLMQPSDAVKLIYQNEFGGGHLIRNEESCRRYLLMEYESVNKNVGAQLLEPVGNGIVRVFLNAIEHNGISPERLCDLFIESSQRVAGSIDAFKEKLDVLLRVCAEVCFAFSKQELEKYIEQYAKIGYPAVSHSEQYHAAYAPAYRIICKELLSDYNEAG